MSEQSGGGHITREQVERAIAKPRNIDYRELPMGWREWAPDYVIAAEAADDWDAEHAALARWRDELAAAVCKLPSCSGGACRNPADCVSGAAEPVRRVARWSEADGLYRLDPPHEYSMAGGVTRAYLVARVQAIAWGYEIEGGPEPVRDWKSDRAIAAIWPTPPIDDSSPERLRERREALGWTTAYAGHWVPWFDHTDVERAESGRGMPGFVSRYAAALSAEEARRGPREVSLVDADAAAGRAAAQMASWPTWKRALSERVAPADSLGLRSRREDLRLSRQEAAALVNRSQSGNHCWTEDDVRGCEDGPVGTVWREAYAAALSAEEARLAEEERLACAYRESDGTLVWDDSPLPEPERPAPRFKVGDWVRVVSNGTVYQVGEIATPFGGMAYYFRETGGAENSWQAAALEPASPPAPEVVDVPQPRIVVKRCDEVEAEWTSADATILIVTHDALDDAIFVPLPLLRAMLADIDAQQGGAS